MTTDLEGNARELMALMGGDGSKVGYVFVQVRLIEEGESPQPMLLTSNVDIDVAKEVLSSAMEAVERQGDDDWPNRLPLGHDA